MKKYVILIVAVLVLTGCSTNKPTQKAVNETKEKIESTNNDVGLQLTEEMIESGQTKENNELVKELDELITSNPTLGEPDDFTIYYTNVYGKNGDTGDYQMIFIGVNRMGRAISNMTFQLSMDVAGELFLDRRPMSLGLETFGEIENNKAFPIFVNISKDKENLLSTIEKDNYVLAVDDFKTDF